MAKRLLVVAYDLAPLDVISSQRVNYFVEFFSSIGLEVDVITSKKHPVDGPLTDTSAFKRLSRAATIYQIDYMPRFLRGEKEADRPLPNKESKKRNFLKKIKPMLIKLFGAFFDHRTLWAVKCLRFLRRHTINHRYDYVLTSSLPVSVNLVGWYLQRNNAAHYWVADFRDLWSRNHLIPYSAFSRSFDSFIEKFFLKRSDLISTVSESLKADMVSLHGIPGLVVMNGLVARDYQNLVADYAFFDALDCNKKVNIVYAGSLYAERRNPAPLLKMLIMSSERENFAIHFFGPDADEIKRLLPDIDLSDLCFFHGRRPRSDVLAIQKAASLNMFLESGEPDAKGVITGKLFELIAMGRPVLSIGPKSDFESVRILSSSTLLIRWEDIGEFGVQELAARACLPTQPSKNIIDKFSRRKMCEELWCQMEKSCH